MKSAISTILSTLFFLSSANDINDNSSNWAVLVAGSNGYYNYRHQSDIAHSYQILTKMGGFPPEKVIVMIYNDIVNSSQNPFPGQLFNEPGGRDVYGDIVVSYSGESVTAKNFLNVIQGIQSEGTKDKPVLKSQSNDNVFIYFSDHGAPGLVAMPVGDPLYATDLNKALQYMYRNGMYKKLVFYVEACESGSMFDGLLPNNTGVFATTAATPDQPSYAFYYNQTLQTYMADEYSIRWMQDSTMNWANVRKETLLEQYKDVASIVNESQPQMYGDFSFDWKAIEDFEAYEDRDLNLLELLKNSIKKEQKFSYSKQWVPSSLAVSSRDVVLATLQNRYLSAKSTEIKLEIALLIEQEMEHRLESDLLFDELIKYVMYSYMNEYESNEDIIDSIKYGHLRPSNYECLKSVYSQYEYVCEKWTDYSMKYVNALVNLCELFDNTAVITNALQNVC